MSYVKGRKIGLDALPTEVVYSIFSSLSTPSLLPISSVSRRIHNLVHRIIHQRILSAVQITDHKLTLDYFYPVIEKTKSPIEFKYNGTYQRSMNTTSEDLRDLYSHFLSVYPEANPVKLQPIDKQNSLISTSQDLIVEPYESFSQLCIIARLLRPSAHNGMFRSCITLGVKVIRVWRNWLAGRIKQKEAGILWIDPEQDMGMKVRVLERIPKATIIFSEEEISYVLVVEELLIRSTKLLLRVEESLEQEAKHQGMFCGLDGEYDHVLGSADLFSGGSIG